jgi:hypothetical protein
MQWPKGNGHCDIGILRLSASGGHNAGEFTGAYPVVWGLDAHQYQTEFDSAGYPASGNFFASARGGYGDAPYFCDNVWDGRYLSNIDATPANDAPLVGDGLYLVKSCGATGGSSGGPVFTLYNGAWYVNGVNNIGDNPTLHPENGGLATLNAHQIFDTVVSGPFVCQYLSCSSPSGGPRISAAARGVVRSLPALPSATARALEVAMGARADGSPLHARLLHPGARGRSLR